VGVIVASSQPVDRTRERAPARAIVQAPHNRVFADDE
jgi:hypothetical protein